MSIKNANVQIGRRTFAHYAISQFVGKDYEEEVMKDITEQVEILDEEGNGTGEFEPKVTGQELDYVKEMVSVRFDFIGYETIEDKQDHKRNKISIKEIPSHRISKTLTMTKQEYAVMVGLETYDSAYQKLMTEEQGFENAELTA